MNKLWFGDDLSKAVNKPRLHSQMVPDQRVFYENNKDYRESMVYPRVNRSAECDWPN